MTAGFSSAGERRDSAMSTAKWRKRSEVRRVRGEGTDSRLQETSAQRGECMEDASYASLRWRECREVDIEVIHSWDCRGGDDVHSGQPALRLLLSRIR